jgi:hypothetical protein
LTAIAKVLATIVARVVASGFQESYRTPNGPRKNFQQLQDISRKTKQLYVYCNAPFGWRVHDLPYEKPG